MRDNVPLLDAARLAIDEGRWEAAYGLLSEQVRANPRDPDAANALQATSAVLHGNEALERGETGQAVSFYREALARLPDAYRVCNLEGNAWLEMQNLDRAEACYRRAVELNPGYAAGHCNLGSVRLASGDAEGALGHLARALALRPDFPHALVVSAEASLRCGRPAQAVTALKQACSLEPDDADLMGKLGEALIAAGEREEALAVLRQLSALPDAHPLHRYLLARVLFDLGRPLDAEADLAIAREHMPRHPDILLMTGNLLQLRGRDDEAERYFRDAVSLAPDLADTHGCLGDALFNLGRYDEASQALETALRINPRKASAHTALAAVLFQQGRLEDALNHCDNAVRLEPSATKPLTAKGSILQEMLRFAEAEACFRHVLELTPEAPQALADLADCLLMQRRSGEAETLSRKALHGDSGCAKAWRTLAEALESTGRLDESLACRRECVRLEPDSKESWNNLGHIHLMLGRHEEAAAAFGKAVEISPDAIPIWGNRLFSLNFSSEATSGQYLAEARHCAAIMRAAAGSPLRANPTRTPDQPLRIGLLSGDLRNHPVGYFLESVLGQIRPERLALYGYHSCPSGGDALTERIRPRFSCWRDVSMLKDRMLAERIRDDGIHILIDLAGYTEYNRLPVFAFRPAPVQVSWLGYFASTGMSEIDYYLTDPVSSPPGSESHFTETLWRLPDTRLCFTPPPSGETPAVAPAPAVARGHVTFGCFQRLGKITPAMIALWCEILKQTPGSRLILKGTGVSSDIGKSGLLREFAARGIPADRLDLEAVTSRADYFAAYARVDLMLDTLPFPGGTTTCEALWMGVPTVTLTGDRLLSRQGESLLSAAGLHDWVARNEAEYVRKAVAFAARQQDLAQLRAGLRQRVSASPLMDARRFARHLEQALNDMWERFSHTETVA